MNTNVAKPNGPPLPASPSEFMACRKVTASVRLNDLVERLHVKLWAGEEYQRFWDAIYDEQAVEGSLIADTLQAARLVRDLASKEVKDDATFELVIRSKLATIGKCLRVVMRRYGQSRNERRLTVSGVRVQDELDLHGSDASLDLE